MSRIHEALKKAEQERAAAQTGSAQGGLPQPSFATSSTADPPVTVAEEPPVAAEAQVPTAPFLPPVPSFANSFSLDALLARCPQLQWQPDQKTMLFFNGDDSKRGTEEFRTLRSRDRKSVV